MTIGHRINVPAASDFIREICAEARSSAAAGMMDCPAQSNSHEITVVACAEAIGDEQNEKIIRALALAYALGRQAGRNEAPE